MKYIGIVAAIVAMLFVAGCEDGRPVSDTGIGQVTATVVTGSDGMTSEQRNITKRIALENQPGSVKHLYVISAQTGSVLLYSTVDGKVTSSGKRLAPYRVNGRKGATAGAFEVQFGPTTYFTSEVLQSDGTYGSSIPYLYWFDIRGVYHQHYLGENFVHVSEQPIAVGDVVLNIELLAAQGTGNGTITTEPENHELNGAGAAE